MAVPAWRRFSALFWKWLRPGAASAIPVLILTGKSIITTQVAGVSSVTTQLTGTSIITTRITGKSIIE